MSDRTISVIIPILNSSATLEASLGSVLKQSLVPHELIIVDNGCSDNSIELISEFSKFTSIPIKVVIEKKIGAGPARNKGVQESSSKYIAFLDSDDIWKIDKLEKQFSVIKNRSKTICGHYARYIDFNSNVIGHSRFFESNFEFSKSAFEGFNLPFLLSSWMMAKEDFMEIGGFDERFRLAQDLEFFIRAAKLGFVPFVIPEILMDYRIWKDSSTSSNYIEQYLSAEYIKLSPILQELPEFTEGAKSLFNKNYKAALAGQFLRNSLNAKQSGRYLQCACNILSSFVLNPRGFLTKFRKLYLGAINDN